MTAIPSLSLRSRIRLGIAALLIPLALLIGVAEFALLEVRNSLETTTAEALNEVVPITHVQADTHAARRLGIDALTEDDDGADDRQAFRDLAADIDADFAELNASPGLAEEHRFTEIAAFNWRRATHALEDAIAARPLSVVQADEAVQRFTSLVDASLAQIDRAAATSNADLHAEVAAAESRSRLITVLFALIALLSIAGMVLVASRLSRSLTVPLSLLADGSRRFGQGELEHRISVPRDDELGGLAKTLNGMADELAAHQHELEQSQRSLIEAQKLEAVGQLAGGIAHDFNNLLLVVGSYADFLHESFEDDDPRRDDAAEIRKATERASELTRQLLTFARRDVTQPVPLDVAATILQLAGTLRGALTAGIDLQLVLEPGLHATVIDPGRLEQALLNLVLNARNAMPEGGILTIRADTVAVDERTPVDGVAPGSYVAIAVSDSGHGMTEEVLRRALDPFFTTRADAGGSGLGLATVYGIVASTGGSTTIESSIDEGTTVVLYLPATTESVEAEADPEPARTNDRGDRVVVLVAEDEPMIRDITTRILSGHGYVVLAAASGAEALELERLTKRIVGLLSDGSIPGM